MDLRRAVLLCIGIPVGLVTADPLLAQFAPACANGRKACEPWDRQWSPENTPTVGDVVTRDGKMSEPARELGGIAIGQDVSVSRRAFEAMGKRIVETTEFRDHPHFRIHNLISEAGERYGNVGVCRGKVTSIVLYATSLNSMMRVMKERVAKWGQPTVSFDTIEATDGAEAYDHMIFTWDRLGYSIDFPMGEGDSVKGAQVMRDGKACR